jgi:ribosomal protein S13
LDANQKVNLGCYQKVKGIGITSAHAINAYGILQNDGLDKQAQLRMLKNVQFTETEDPIFYNLLYDSDVKPEKKIEELEKIIYSLILPCDENI